MTLKSLYLCMIHPCTPGILTIKNQKQKNDQRKMNNGKEDPMNSDETEADGVMYKKSRGYYYNPLLYYKRNLDKT